MTPLTPAQQALAADPEAVRYALNLARRFARRNPRLADEYESAALYGLVRAAGTYTPGTGVPFHDFWLPRVVAGVLCDTRKASMPKGYRRTGRRAGAPSTVATLPPDLAAGEDPVGWAVEYQDEVRGVAARGTPPEGEAVALYYGRAGATLRSVGGRLGIGSKNVYNLIHNALRLAKARAPRVATLPRGLLPEELRVLPAEHPGDHPVQGDQVDHEGREGEDAADEDRQGREGRADGVEDFDHGTDSGGLTGA